MSNVFLVRQYMRENEFRYSRIDREAMFSTFEAAYDFMIKELCPNDLTRRDLELLRNEIVEMPLDAPIIEGFLSRRVYLSNGKLHFDYAENNKRKKSVKDETGIRLVAGDLVRLLPDYLYPGAAFFNGQFGILLETDCFGVSANGADFEADCDKSNKVFYITNAGIGTICFASLDELEPLTEPLEDELYFLNMLSEHIRGRRTLSNDVIERLTDMSKGLLYLRKLPVFDFSKGTIIRSWLSSS